MMIIVAVVIGVCSGEKADGDTNTTVSPLRRQLPPRKAYKSTTTEDEAGPFLVGVVGGIGPAASLRLQQIILEKDLLRCSRGSKNNGRSGFLADECHTPLLVYTNPRIPNNNRAALGIGPPSVDALVDTAVALRKAGADMVAFACTAACTWMDQVSIRADVPVLDLLDLTAKRVADDGHSSVGLLEVDGTIAAGAFGAAFQRYGIQVELPRAQEQELVMNAVADLKSGVEPAEPLAALEMVATQLVRRGGVSALVLGCTEIATAMGSANSSAVPGVPYVDTLEVLAEEIIHLSMEKASPNIRNSNSHDDDSLFTGFLST